MIYESVQSFNTRSGGTIVAMEKQPDDAIPDILVLSSASTVRAVKAIAVSVHHKGESRDCTRLKKMVVRNLEQEHRQKHSRDRQLEKLASGAAAAKGKSEGKGEKKLWRMCTMGNDRSMLSRR